MIHNRKFHEGAVSLFMVVFAMLIITVVTVGFLRLMTADQRQATENDLSQSAYDSALAGVEDAKRALLACQRSGCDKATVLASPQCNLAVRTLAGATEIDGEVKIQSTALGSIADRELDQAYTCVTVVPDTSEYISTVNTGESKIVPLKGVQPFTSVRVSWFTSKDLNTPSGAVNRAGISAMRMLAQSAWPENRPSVLRAQLMQYGTSFNLTDFDAETSGQSNANTIFLYPTTVTTDTVSIAGIDGRKEGSNAFPSQGQMGSTPYPAACRANISAGGYACSMVIELPRAINASSDARTAFLRLVPFYKSTTFQIELLGTGGTPVLFDGVQPKVDSTGRANDLFRRVEARVDVDTNSFPFPEAAVDVADNFCKDFTVTADAYIESADACTP